MDKGVALLFDLFSLLLGDRPAHHVRLAQRVTAKLLEYLNDLLLIDNATVGHG